jgi:CheY-like chemotaxis protein
MSMSDIRIWPGEPDVGATGVERHAVQEAARRAGLREVVRPTIEHVERRRSELIWITCVLFVVLTTGLVVLSFAPEGALQLNQVGRSLNLARGALFALAIAFGAYVVDKERRLRYVERALLNERVMSAALMNRLREISLLNDAGRAVTSSLELDEVLDIILKSASELLQADEGSVMLLHGRSLLVAAAVGRTVLFVGERREISEGVAGYVARTNQPLLVQDEVDATELAELIGTPIGRGGSRVRSALSVPLEARGEVLGVLNLNVTKGERRYAEYDLRMLQLFAQHAAVAILAARILGVDRELDRTQVAELERIRADVVGRMTQSFDAPTPHRPAKTTDAGIRVLLVEDDPGLLRFLHVALETEGFTVDLASDGDVALERVKKGNFDVMLLDLAIPVMDGWQVLDSIRDLPRRPRVICLTAKDGVRDASRAWTLGASEYVRKPFELRDLVQLVSLVAGRTTEEQDDRRRQALKDLFSAPR